MTRTAATLRLLRHAPAGLLFAGLALECLLGVLPVVFMVASSGVIGQLPEALRLGVDSPAWSAVQTMLLAGMGAMLGQQITVPLRRVVVRGVQRHVDTAIHGQLLDAALGGPDLALLDHAKGAALLREATEELRNERHTPGAAAGASLTLVSRYLTFALASALASVLLAWWAALALMTAGLGLRIAHRVGYDGFLRSLFSLATLRRRAWYLRDLALGRAIAKESRIFGLADWVAQRAREARLAALEPVLSTRVRIYVRPFAAAAIGGSLVAGAVYAALGWYGGQAVIPLTDLVLVAQAGMVVLSIGSFFEESDVERHFGSNALAAVTELESVVSRPPAVADRGAAPALYRDLVLKDVRFAYPGATQPVFSRLNLTIEAGTTVAIVGANGVGKSTLLKLICGFLAPSAGSVEIDGQPLDRLDRGLWQAKVSAVFQDFARYELSAADNIALGAVAFHDRERDLRWAAERAGCLDVIERLPHGFQTILSRQYSGGVDLSGGQWQRVAMARALFAVRQGAGLLLLDEPTANLDVRAEADFFDRFLSIRTGVTTVLVSHRFSTVRMADRIIVLRDGAIAEDGTHDELLAAGGQYARLFTLQAARFDIALEAP